MEPEMTVVSIDPAAEDRLMLALPRRLGVVSCFPTRAEMRKHLPDIAWETEVWCADAPSPLDLPLLK